MESGLTVWLEVASVHVIFVHGKVVVAVINIALISHLRTNFQASSMQLQGLRGQLLKRLIPILEKRLGFVPQRSSLATLAAHVEPELTLLTADSFSAVDYRVNFVHYTI